MVFLIFFLFFAMFWNLFYYFFNWLKDTSFHLSNDSQKFLGVTTGLFVLLSTLFYGNILNLEIVFKDNLSIGILFCLDWMCFLLEKFQVCYCQTAQKYYLLGTTVFFMFLIWTFPDHMNNINLYHNLLKYRSVFINSQDLLSPPRAQTKIFGISVLMDIYFEIQLIYSFLKVLPLFSNLF